jgi:hypothetical protein
VVPKDSEGAVGVLLNRMGPYAGGAVQERQAKQVDCPHRCADSTSVVARAGHAECYTTKETYLIDLT